MREDLADPTSTVETHPETGMIKTLCVLLTLASSARLFAAPVANCRVVIVDSTSSADSSSVAAACRTAQARYLLLTGRHAPTGIVRVGDFNGFAIGRVPQPWKFDWPSESSCRRIATKLGYLRGSALVFCADQTKSMLPHELGHLIGFAAQVRGSPPPPAWYEEARAMWMEPPELQMHRLDQAREWRRSSPALASLMAVSQSFVLSKEASFRRTETIRVGRCRGVCGPPVPWHTRKITWTTFRDGAVHVDTLYDSAASSAHADSVDRFYVYSLAALYYVRSKGGIDALHLLADRVRTRSGKSDLLHGIRGIPKAGPGREADWRRWLKGASTIVP
jgi:hypothetical protein